MNRHWDVFALSRLFSGLKRLNMTSPPCLICYRCEGELLDFFFHFFFKFGFKGRLRLRAHIWGNCCVYISLARFLPPPHPSILFCAPLKRGTVSPLLHGLSLTCFSSPFYYRARWPFVAPPQQPLASRNSHLHFPPTHTPKKTAEFCSVGTGEKKKYIRKRIISICGANRKALTSS